MGAELDIPDEAQLAAEREIARYALSGPDAVTAAEDAIRVAAPLIVAAELERLVATYAEVALVHDGQAKDAPDEGRYDKRYWEGRAASADRVAGDLRRRASELRGEV